MCLDSLLLVLELLTVAAAEAMTEVAPTDTAIATPVMKEVALIRGVRFPSISEFRYSFVLVNFVCIDHRNKIKHLSFNQISAQLC